MCASAALQKKFFELLVLSNNNGLIHVSGIFLILYTYFISVAGMQAALLGV